MYEIEFTPEAIEDLKSFRKFEQQTIISGLDSQLKYEPTVETRNRFRMRPNDVAEWELRLGKYRVFYNVEIDVQIVSIEVVGFKRANQLFVRGKRRDLWKWSQFQQNRNFFLTYSMKVQKEGLILQTTTGQQFVLLSLEDWQGFEVGDSDDFEQEVKATSENKALLAFLAERRSNGKRVPLTDVKKQLGLG